MGQGQFADLGLHPGYIDRGLLVGLLLAKDAGRALLEPGLPVRDLVGVHIESIRPGKDTEDVCGACLRSYLAKRAA